MSTVHGHIPRAYYERWYDAREEVYRFEYEESGQKGPTELELIASQRKER